MAPEVDFVADKRYSSDNGKPVDEERFSLIS
jgi:hypothetical protein